MKSKKKFLFAKKNKLKARSLTTGYLPKWSVFIFVGLMVLAGYLFLYHAKAATVVNVNAVADTYINSISPATNYDSNTALRTDGDPVIRSYVKFNISGVTGKITKATLKIYAMTSNTAGYDVAKIDNNDWDYKAITYNSAPTIGAVLGSQGPINAGTTGIWTSVDVTSFINANGIYNLALIAKNTTATRYNSKEAGANIPQLILETDSTAGDPVVAAAGDIACDTADPNFNNNLGSKGACHYKATSDMILNLNPSAVLLLGDNQYECGQAANFTQAYNPTWGRFKGITKPALGNHEYGASCHVNDPSGYFNYFGAAAGDPTKGYYSFDIGSWHILAINSECSHIGGCAVGSPQETWVKAEIAAHPGTCTLAYWHEPRFSSGEHGDAQQMTYIWNDLVGHAAVVLSGHNHDYERFDHLGTQTYDPNYSTTTGTPSYQNPIVNPNGIREFIAGTGGKNHYGFHASGSTVINPPLTGEQVRDDTAFGILKLTLHKASYDWRFMPEPGKTFTDSGSDTCVAN